ncbi:MAG: hypothetical protein C4K58_00545 [Flavobacteriaceae bacterium]|nr:MAG: hypothetical protein C4K58_00545 [Flavobacteriaceae bacterium]
MDHVEGDSYQNDAPKISLNIEDFRIDHDFDSLDGQKISIPESIQELEDKDGEKYSLTYSTLFVEELDETFLTSKNQLSFTATEELGMKFTWKGKCEDFYSQNGEIAFTVEATVGTEAEQEDLYDYDE